MAIAIGFVLRKLDGIEEKVMRTNKFVFEAMQDARIKALRTIQSLDLVMGHDDADGTIIMYTKPSCDHCGDFFETTFPEIQRKLIDRGKARFIVRYLVNPNDSLEVNETMIIYCGMKDTGGFQIQTTGSSGAFVGTACAGSEDIRTFIIETSRKARQAGIALTPTFLVNGIEISGNRNFTRFEELLSGIPSGID
jgi:glutaredoxin